LKVIACEEQPDGSVMQWLCETDLIPSLIAKLSPENDSDIADNAAQALVDIMGVFDSKPLNATSLNNRLRKSPLLFGVPFVMIMVVASYALVPFTQTKYELQDRKVSKVTKEQELGLENRKRKFDIRQEYFKLSAKAAEDWEPKRIERPAGTPEWGIPPPEPSRKQS